MTRTLTEKLESLPDDRRKRIEARAEELIEQELTLRELRKALEMTQTALAERLNIGQDTVSRLERRTDMLLSTLHDYVQGLGGRLELNVEFPGHRKVRLKTLHEPNENNNEAA
ncbi:MAG: helix-turn-helix domain-containing protein [Wenzhouxiangellaceae bacterium]